MFHSGNGPGPPPQGRAGSLAQSLPQGLDAGNASPNWLALGLQLFSQLLDFHLHLLQLSLHLLLLSLVLGPGLLPA